MNPFVLRQHDSIRYIVLFQPLQVDTLTHTQVLHILQRAFLLFCDAVFSFAPPAI